MQFYSRQRAFDAESWRSSGRRTRGQMVPDLVRSNRLDGLTAGEVKGLLVPPDTADETGLSYRYTGESWPFLSFSDWEYVLEIEFDTAGGVSSVSSYD